MISKKTQDALLGLAIAGAWVFFVIKVAEWAAS
jgi:hypothetical protein